MANVDWMAFRPVMHRDGSPYNGSFTKCYAGANLFLGDLVTLGATGTAGSTGGAYAQVVRAATTNLIRGIVVGWQGAPVGNGSATLEDKYCRSGNVVYVADTSSLILQGQTVSTGLAAADVGLNIDFVVTAAGDTTTGESGYEVNDGTEATTNTLDLKLVGLVESPNNDITLANMKALVMTNLNWNTDQVVGV